MDVLRNFRVEDLPRLVRERGDLRPAVATIGNFDGLHQGHRRILDEVLRRSRELGGQSVVVTFHPHPQKVLHPESAPLLILTLERKVQLLELMGFDFLVIIPFDREFARRSAAEFVEQVLVEALGVVEVLVGANFAFGRGKSGNLEFLQREGEKRGFRARAVEEVVVEGQVVSSSRIRQAIIEGRVEEAARLLGYPFHVTGQVVRGIGRGRTLRFPTANLACNGEILPQMGVYLTRFEMRGNVFAGLTNVGVKPTFGLEELSVETYLLDFDGDIYDESARLFFLRRLRDELRFPDASSLTRQMEYDLEEARRFFGFPPPSAAPSLGRQAGRERT